ncbi:prepilin-type N-terminal cleavage/methylation domain-containing protein [Paucibacter oligotrophus]|uniref:Prepilin-type N-terminal cleavage/methylation domain-containing protein n=1 Tax=Roseateles oligotrophus TaxID=1769250 RepID=A0A840L4R7_9BURK|nr:prepilin-type N-terminal cleavage/methylation domain-containing protein [Roseateles oligotrophus]MBB4841525.1 prepilin-type N-terminal cleavage/methylation domain-containing protein [Roseateles oligotrophus]
MLAQLNISHRDPRGLSLVELMVVIAVLGIVLAVAIPSFGDMLARKRVQLIAAELVSDLAFARSESGLKSYGIHTYFQQSPVMSCYLIVQRTGPIDRCDCSREVGSACAGTIGLTEIKTAQIPSSTGVTIKVLAPLAISSGLTGLQFSPLHMVPSAPELKVLVASSRGSQPKLQIELNGMGRVKLCCPDGSFTGVQPCV